MPLLPQFEKILNLIQTETKLKSKEIYEKLEEIEEEFPEYKGNKALVAYLLAKKMDVEIPLITPRSSDKYTNIAEIEENIKGFSLRGYITKVWQGKTKKNTDMYGFYIIDETGGKDGRVWGDTAFATFEEANVKEMGSYMIKGAQPFVMDSSKKLVVQLSGQYVEIEPIKPKDFNLPEIDDIVETDLSNIEKEDYVYVRDALIISESESSYVGCPNCFTKVKNVEEGDFFVCSRCTNEHEAVKHSNKKIHIGTDKGSATLTISPMFLQYLELPDIITGKKVDSFGFVDDRKNISVQNIKIHGKALDLLKEKKKKDKKKKTKKVKKIKKKKKDDEVSEEDIDIIYQIYEQIDEGDGVEFEEYDLKEHIDEEKMMKTLEYLLEQGKFIKEGNNYKKSEKKIKKKKIKIKKPEKDDEDEDENEDEDEDEDENDDEDDEEKEKEKEKKKKKKLKVTSVDKKEVPEKDDDEEEEKKKDKKKRPRKTSKKKGKDVDLDTACQGMRMILKFYGKVTGEEFERYMMNKYKDNAPPVKDVIKKLIKDKKVEETEEKGVKYYQTTEKSGD